jgi:hypothetical protein
MKLDVNTDWEDFEELPSKQKLVKKKTKNFDAEKVDKEKKITHRRKRDTDENIR